MKKGRKKRRVLERYNGSKLGWLHDSVFFILAIAAVFCIFRFCIGIAVVGGDSMSPTLMDGDFVLYSRIVSSYGRGDIVSMRVPAGEYYVKRIIATEGDVVDIRNGSVYVNDQILEEPWAYGATEEEKGAIIYPYTVRSGNVFVLGDNRPGSMDSRAFGEVSLRQIRGRVILQAGSGSEGLYLHAVQKPEIRRNPE